MEEQNSAKGESVTEILAQIKLLNGKWIEYIAILMHAKSFF